MQHFNSFPDDCILLIFGRLPLRTLLQIEIVCHKWKSLQMIASRERRSLLLLVGKRAMDLIEFSEFIRDEKMFNLVSEVDNKPMFVSPYIMAKLHGLKLDNLNKQKCDWLIQKFPNIRSLHISIAGFDTNHIAKPVTSLFTAWSSKLSTLKLYLPDTSDESKYISLFEQINTRLLALRNLTLGILTYFNKTYQPLNNYQLDLPVLSRLNRFYFSSSDQAAIILNSLVRYGQPNENLKQIRLNRMSFTNESVLRKYLSLDRHLTRHFTDLLRIVSLSSLSLVELHTLFRQFPNQQSLITICFDQMSYSIADLINSLSLLKHLISFHFGISNKIPDNIQLGFSLPQLNSIKILCLKGFNSHTLLSQLNIAWIFPSIQILVMFQAEFQYGGTHWPVESYFGMCAKCNRNGIKENEEQFRACLRLFLEPLKQCTKLRKIDFKLSPQYNIEDIVEECLGSKLLSK